MSWVWVGRGGRVDLDALTAGGGGDLGVLGVELGHAELHVVVAQEPAQVHAGLGGFGLVLAHVVAGAAATEGQAAAGIGDRRWSRRGPSSFPR